MRNRKMLATFFVLFQVLGLVSSIHAVLQTRTPQGAIAWAVSLNTMPVIAVPAYWVLGRSRFNGYRNAWRDSELNLDQELEALRINFEPYRSANLEDVPNYRAVRNLTDSAMVTSNHVDLLVDGHATYDSIYQGIEAAQDYILFQFYILRNDTSGNRFRDLLVRKAAEGLDVYVLFDELGSAELSKEWINELRETGVSIFPFNTRQGPQNRFQLNFRNHRKIVVVDGHYAWVGGLNVGDDYLGEDEKLSPWRDTHLRIEGPAALAAQAVFLSDWHWASKELLSGLNWNPRPADELQGDGMDVMVFQSGPADPEETASLFFTHTINHAQQRVWIATPYFVPDKATMVALRLALLKGLDVRIITPELNDNWFVRHAANVYLSELSRLGAKVYFFQNGFMHQKVMLIDDKYSFVGTVNFDNRSFRLNFEITGVVADRGFAAQLEEMLNRDLSVSVEVPDLDLEQMSFWERLKARSADLLAPVL